MRLALALVLALAPAATAQTDTPAEEPRTVTVSLTYRTEKRHSYYHPGFYAIGFYPFFGARLPLTAVAGEDAHRGSFTYSGQTMPFRVLGIKTAAPRLEVDVANKGDWAKITPVADSRYRVRRAGYVVVQPDIATGRRIEMTIKAYGGRAPTASLVDRGGWRGTLAVGDKRYTIWVYDRRCNGTLDDDGVWIDADGDGKIARIEQVKIGERILVDGQEITFGRPTHDAKVPVQLGSGKMGRDLTAALAKAPVDGKPLPDLTFTDQTGKEITLSSLKGKVVLLNFWAVW